jgi:hypothetical protein
MFLEESLGDEFEGFIFLGDDSDITWFYSRYYFYSYIVDDPRDFFEFIREFSISYYTSCFTYSFEFFLRSWEYVSYIVRF